MGKWDIGGNDNAMMMIDREANFTFVGTTLTLIFQFKVGTSKQDIQSENYLKESYQQNYGHSNMYHLLDSALIQLYL